MGMSLAWSEFMYIVKDYVVDNQRKSVHTLRVFRIDVNTKSLVGGG
jgi:hypothetical protein